MPKRIKGEYPVKLRDPRWQKRRLRILERDNFTCQCCRDTETTLHVHHRWYETDQEPWDATDRQLVTLCEDCHADEGRRRDVDRQLAKALQMFGAHVGDVELLALAFENAKQPVDANFICALTQVILNPDERRALSRWWADLPDLGGTLSSIISRRFEESEA